MVTFDRDLSSSLAVEEINCVSCQFCAGWLHRFHREMRSECWSNNIRRARATSIDVVYDVCELRESCECDCDNGLPIIKSHRVIEERSKIDLCWLQDHVLGSEILAKCWKVTFSGWLKRVDQQIFQTLVVS